MTERLLNRYAPPTARVDDRSSSPIVGDARFFSTRGRIGRLRYMAWMLIAWLLQLALLEGFVALVHPDRRIELAATLITSAALCGVSLVFVVRRAHDTNLNGWWSLTLLIPLVAIVWGLVPGSKGENRFGAPPPPGGWGLRILGLLYPVASLGVILMIAYQAFAEETETTLQGPISIKAPAQGR